MIERRIAIGMIAGTLAVIGGGALFFGLRGAVAPRTPVVQPEAAVIAPDAPRRWLDGAVLAEGAAQPPAVAIVVDHAPEARPQSGIADAPLVFEVPVEGGRTRFLAVFPLDAPVREVGPVRSARPYLAELAHAIGVPLVHVGGSAAALDILRSNNWAHIDQYYDAPFTRVTFRRAPFNVYTSLSDLSAFIAERRDGDTESFVPREPFFSFAERRDAPDVQPIAAIEILHSEPVSWQFDANERRYTRMQGGRVVRDADGKPMRAENVVLLRVRSRVLDDVGRLAVTFPTLLAPYDAVVYAGGKKTAGQWILGSPGGLRITDTAGNPVALVPGTTWVEILDRAFDAL